LENVRVVLFQLGVSPALKEVWGEDVLHGDLLKNGRFLFYHANFMPISFLREHPLKARIGLWAVTVGPARPWPL
jgi:hypothetical protein